jgi:hypothetical protein
MSRKGDRQMRKLPFIADKDLYAAVMGACSWIRETGYFNKACSYYANKYSVDVDDVKQYVRIAQQNGRKASSKCKNTKFKYYLVHGHFAGERGTLLNCYDKDSGKWELVKASNKKNAIKQLSKHDDFSEFGSWFVYGEVIEFLSLDEVKNYIQQLKREFKHGE